MSIADIRQQADAADQQLELLLEEYQRWGVQIVFGRPPAGSESYQVPGESWITWPDRAVYALTRDPRALLHELAHAINGNRPDLADEYGDGMHAFEFFTGRRLGLPTRASVARLSETALLTSLAGAVRLGLLREDGPPTYQRAPTRAEHNADNLPRYIARLRDQRLWASQQLRAKREQGP